VEPDFRNKPNGTVGDGGKLVSWGGEGQGLQRTGLVTLRSKGKREKERNRKTRLKARTASCESGDSVHGKEDEKIFTRSEEVKSDESHKRGGVGQRRGKPCNIRHTKDRK